MFLSGLSKSWVDRMGDQHAQGAFLLLVSPAYQGSLSIATESPRPYRGLVRYVKMSQSGHFMVGSVSIRSQAGMRHIISLSGAYGADGLIREVPNAIYAMGTDLPAELHDKWNRGGGHNSVGMEAPDMDAWAKELEWPSSTYGPSRKKR